MALAMLVGDPDAGQPVVGPGAAQRLAALGISRVSLLEDPTGIAVVLEGWAFDSAHVDEAVRAIYPDAIAGVRVFREIQHVAVVRTVAERSR